MSNRFLKKCVLCKEEYKYCGKCSGFSHLPKYMSSYDTQNCKTITESVSEYVYDKSSKEKIKDILEQCDLSKIDRYSNAFKKYISEIFDKDISEIVEFFTEPQEKIDEVKDEIVEEIREEVKEVIEEEPQSTETKVVQNTYNKKQQHKKMQYQNAK